MGHLICSMVKLCVTYSAVPKNNGDIVWRATDLFFKQLLDSLLAWKRLCSNVPRKEQLLPLSVTDDLHIGNGLHWIGCHVQEQIPEMRKQLGNHAGLEAAGIVCELQFQVLAGLDDERERIVLAGPGADIAEPQLAFWLLQRSVGRIVFKHDNSFKKGQGGREPRPHLHDGD